MIFGLEVIVNRVDVSIGVIFFEVEIEIYGLIYDLIDGWNILDYDCFRKIFYRWYRCSI